MFRRTTMRAKGQLTLPTEIRSALNVDEGDEIEFSVLDDGTVIVRGLKLIPADQAWFWTAEWQEGEREASRQLAAGKSTVHSSTDEFLASLGE
ncbi:MAG: AbrB/MazE/SpoVT family DNA-binding domain-containing protein [Sporichthyaceae bacterium]